MSLLINALKKYRQESASLLTPEVGFSGDNKKMGAGKKIALITLGVVIVILLTALVTFQIVKHFEKDRIAHMLEAKGGQADKIKALIAEKKLEGASPKAVASDGLKARLQAKVQQAKANNAQAPQATAVENATPTSSDVSSPEVAPDVQAVVAADKNQKRTPGRALHRLAAKEASQAPAASDDSQSVDAPANNATAVDAAADDGTSDTSSEADTTGDSDVAPVTVSKNKVNIQMVNNDIGVNNPTYQEALGYMQLNQGDKAAALLENNDPLLMKTQGLSAVLLGQIYLTTGEYALADKMLDHAIMLRAGADIQLLALRAQALFMQGKHQETVDLLSSQSPDLISSPEYYALLANAYMHLDQPSNAVSIFQQIVARFPDSASYWLSLALAYQKTGDASSAMVAYRRASQLSQNDPQVSMFISQQLQSLQTM